MGHFQKPAANLAELGDCAGKHPAHCCGTGPSPLRGNQGCLWDGDYVFFFFLLRLFDAIWLLRALAPPLLNISKNHNSHGFVSGESQELDSMILVGLFQLRILHNSMKTKPIYSAEASFQKQQMLCWARTLWHLLSPWRWWRCISTTATIHGHNFRAGSKSLWSLLRVTGAPWGCPQHSHRAGVAETSAWQHSITINNNINKDNDQLLSGGEAQQKNSSRAPDPLLFLKDKVGWHISLWSNNPTGIYYFYFLMRRLLLKDYFC